MKKLLYILLALPLLTACREKKETAGAAAMYTPEVSVASPLIKDITLTKDYPGYLTTEQTVNLVARVNGTLQSTSFTPGSRVKKGQLLFVIEPTIYKDNVTKAEAALKTAQAQLTYARNNYTRMREALKSDAVSRIQVLQAESGCSRNDSGRQQCRSGTEHCTHQFGILLHPCTLRRYDQPEYHGYRQLYKRCRTTRHIGYPVQRQPYVYLF